MGTELPSDTIDGGTAPGTSKVDCAATDNDAESDGNATTVAKDWPQSEKRFLVVPINDEQWDAVKDLVEKKDKTSKRARGGRPTDHRETLNAIFWWEGNEDDWRNL